MFAMTEAAGAHLTKLLDDEGCPQGVAVRLVFDGKGIGLTLDQERPGDTTFEHDGRKVLLLDEEVSGLLEDNKLDVDSTTSKLTLDSTEERQA